MTTPNDIITQMNQLESILDDFANQRQIGKDVSLKHLDAYYDLLIDYFSQINEVENMRQVEQINALRIVPMNIEERLAYITQRKHHYMGYQQMKTLKSELVKMYAAYRARHQLP